MNREIHGVNTQYQVIGKDKPIMVLLHGWGCNWEIWSPIITKLSETYQLVIPDLPAFGQSDNPQTVWSSTEYATWLKVFVATVIPGKHFILMGHSFGGKISCFYASQQPSELDKLILVDSSGLPAELSTVRKLQQTALSLVPSSFKQSLPRSLKIKLLHMTGSAEDHLNSSPAQRAILKHTIRESLQDRLVAITVPTLLLWGENDLDTPINQAHQFASLIPESKLEVFVNASHFPFIDEPAHFIETISEFAQS